MCLCVFVFMCVLMSLYLSVCLGFGMCVFASLCVPMHVCAWHICVCVGVPGRPFLLREVLHQHGSQSVVLGEAAPILCVCERGYTQGRKFFPKGPSPFSRVWQCTLISFSH